MRQQFSARNGPKSSSETLIGLSETLAASGISIALGITSFTSFRQTAERLCFTAQGKNPPMPPLPSRGIAVQRSTHDTMESFDKRNNSLYREDYGHRNGGVKDCCYR